MHVYRWDLDKTYLATEIESVRGLIRAALETAREKRNVPGSASLLRALVDHDPTARVCVLSGSPTQMRAVLEEKLALDGIDVHELILKDNLGNLRRGRLRAVRDQLGYKLPKLLASRVGLGPAVKETLFGDDSEVDALVYAAYAAVVRGDLTSKDLARILEAGNAYPDAIEAALSAARRIGHADAVQGIFIHVDRGVPLARFHLLAGAVTPVFSWLQAALALEVAGRLRRPQTIEVIRACTAEASLQAPNLAGLLQDAVRRHIVSADHVRGLVEDESLTAVRDAVLRSLDRLGGVVDRGEESAAPDYLGFLRAG
ncbi:MAG: phosphatase domain-containing protein [Myxococcota bacterium]